MKRSTNKLLTLLFGTGIGITVERFVFGRQAEEKIISLRAELNAMRGQLRGSEQKIAGQSAEIIALQNHLSHHTQQLSIAHEEATQLRNELTSARTVSDVTELEADEGAETSEAYVSDDLEVQTAESEGMVILPSDENLPAAALAGEPAPSEDGGVETDEAYVSDDLDIQAAESEGMTILPPAVEADENDDEVEMPPEGEGVETSEAYVSDDLEVQAAESEGMIILPPDADTSNDADDLQKIEGIGPKSEAALLAAGVTTFMQIADMSEHDLAAIITGAGMRRPQSITTWAEQALLAAAEDWEALEVLQDELVGGRRVE